MKMKKIVAVASALSLTAAVAIGGTLAWLTDNSDAKTNTFTYQFGELDKPISITIKDVFPDGEMYPGADLNKDVGVTVNANSMDCYVYLEVQNGFFGTTGVTLGLDTENWVVVDGENEATTIYRYKDVVANSADPRALPDLLDSVSFANTMDHNTLSDLDGKTIVVQAYAIQSDGTGESVANEQAITWFGTH